MKVTLKIQRYNPETDDKPYFQTYTVEVEPTERVLDALVTIKRYQDGSLGFRKSCAHGVCGSDAIRINGKEGLACKTLIKDVVGEKSNIISLEPLKHFPVRRDLMVDQSPFFNKYKSIHPFLINEEPVKEKERIQTQEERMAFDDTTNCILCSSCYSACPILDKNPDFLGPAALAHSYRFLGDSRDRGFKTRLPILDDPNGVRSCENHFECTKSCPRSIKITRRINQTKTMITKYHDKKS